MQISTHHIFSGTESSGWLRCCLYVQNFDSQKHALVMAVKTALLHFRIPHCWDNRQDNLQVMIQENYNIFLMIGY
jgi:hypothetical protein